jgi:hypothetical protein
MEQTNLQKLLTKHSLKPTLKVAVQFIFNKIYKNACSAKILKGLKLQTKLRIIFAP